MTVAAVKRLIDVTDGPSEEQCQEHAERVQEDMTTLIESAFKKANFTKSTSMNQVHNSLSSSHSDADSKRILAMVRIDTTVKINRRSKNCCIAFEGETDPIFSSPAPINHKQCHTFGCSDL
jgi:hypothetical protein